MYDGYAFTFNVYLQVLVAVLIKPDNNDSPIPPPPLHTQIDPTPPHTDTNLHCNYPPPPLHTQILTPTPFLLSSQSLTEFPVTLHTLFPGTSTLLVSAVDVDNKMAVGQWLVVSESHLPSISRGFQISLPTGGGELMRKVGKLNIYNCITGFHHVITVLSSSFPVQTISFTNPYPKKKSFHLSTNRPDVVQFDSILIKVRKRS